jgi:hypothetical protein
MNAKPKLEIPNLDIGEMAKILSEAAGKEIPVERLKILERPAGTVNFPVNLVDGALAGYARVSGKNGYFVDYRLALKDPSSEVLESQRSVFEDSFPEEVNRAALNLLIYLIQNPDAGQRYRSERWLFQPWD